MITIDQNLAVKSFVGDYEIIGNGIAPSLPDMPLKLQVNDFTFVFEFITDNENKEKKITKNVSEGKNASFNVINFDNSLGSGVLNPWYLGTIDGKKLYASFWIWTPNSADTKRLINWTFMLGQ